MKTRAAMKGPLDAHGEFVPQGDAPRIYLSDRGEPLAYHGDPTRAPTVTVEVYEKWYHLFAVRPDGTVEKLDLGMETEAWSDHVPVPALVEAWADAHGYVVDWLSLEMMRGRWLLEACGMQDTETFGGDAPPP